MSTWVTILKPKQFAFQGRNTNPIPYMNQKGLLAHNHTIKKDAYYLYQSMYRSADDLPMLYIVPGTWTINKEHTADASIWVYSNCDSIKFYNADKSVCYGSRSKNVGLRGDSRFNWTTLK